MALSPQFGGIVPSQLQQLLPTNYLQFNNGTNDFAQQYLPEIYEQEVERYGNRTLSGFLKMVGAEMPMTSDQVIWSEQNRLHIAYDNCTLPGGANIIDVAPAAGAATVQNVISVNDTVVILDTVSGAENKGIVTASVQAVVGGVAGSITVATFNGVGINANFTSGNIKVFVYGSAYAKGSSMVNGGNVAAGTQPRISVTPSFQQYSNSPVIIRDQYVISGSDMAQIGGLKLQLKMVLLDSYGI